MLDRLRVVTGCLLVVSTVVLASCTGETPTVETPTPARPTVTRSPNGAGSSIQPGAMETAIPCIGVAKTQTVTLSDNPNQPPLGVGGEEEGGLDEGEPPVEPVDPAASLLPAPPVPGPEATPPSGEQPDPLLPSVYDLTKSTIVTRSTAAEPNVASDGIYTMATWNWHAGLSVNGGQTFRGMDPRTFISAEDFCCDQLTQHIPERGLWVWVMQTGGTEGPNRIRLAATTTDQLGGTNVKFTYWEWTPGTAGIFNPNSFMDRTKIGNTKDNLFIAVNMFLGEGDDAYRGSLIIRMPLDQLVAGSDLSALCYGTQKSVTQVTHAQATMYMGSHESTSALRVWSWPDTSGAPTSKVVPDMQNGAPTGYLNKNFTCPRNKLTITDWCAGKSDSRVQTGWLSGGRIGFSWNAAQEGTEDTPYPYVYSVLIDEASLTTVDHWALKSKLRAVQYPMFAPNSRGDIGGLVMYGGGAGPAAGDPADRAGYPWCVPVIRDAATGEWSWGVIDELESTVDPKPRGDDLLPGLATTPGCGPMEAPARPGPAAA